MQNLSSFHPEYAAGCSNMAQRLDTGLRVKIDAFGPEIARWVDYLLEKDNTYAVSNRPRLRKLGDIRLREPLYRISINNDLDENRTLLVLLHELAHAAVFRRFGTRVKSHGNEWKAAYSSLLSELRAVLGEKASAFPFPSVIMATSAPVAGNGLLYLSDLPQGQRFRIGPRVFEKGELRRTRYFCREIGSHKKYLVASKALVKWERG